MQQEPANPAESSTDAHASPAADPLPEPAAETLGTASELVATTPIEAPPPPPAELLATPDPEPETPEAGPVEVPLTIAPEEPEPIPVIVDGANVAAPLPLESDPVAESAAGGIQVDVPAPSGTTWEGWVTAESQVWVLHPPQSTLESPQVGAAATATTAEAPPEEAAAAEPAPEPGPNWMLAFVCAWAGATSLNEAAVLFSTTGVRLSDMLRNQAFTGYILLGLGLLGFGAEALRWGRKRNAWLVLLPALLTLAGIVLLVLSPNPGRRI